MEPLNLIEIKNFARHFQDYRDDYILIGGAACHLWFASRALDFRRTADMDLVLVIRAQSRPFVERLAQFLMEYRYEAEELTLDNGTRKVRMYRFNAADPNGMPPQIELLGPDNDSLRHAAEQHKIPVKLGTEYSGLSCIILDNAYYDFLLSGRKWLDGVPVADENALVAFKVKAYLNIMSRHSEGIPHGSDGSVKNANKHRNDVLRLLLMGQVEGAPVPQAIRADMETFVSSILADSRIIQNLLRSLNSSIPGLDLDEPELRQQLDALLSLFPITG